MNGHHRVLLVEDQGALRSTLERALRFHGYDVVPVAGAWQGQDVLVREQIDILLTDVALGGDQDGFALAGWARERRPGLPVVLMSGMDMLSPPASGFSDKGMRLLAKPFAVAALMAALGELLEVVAA
jgi:DNA-binding response OmpR family regulator